MSTHVTSSIGLEGQGRLLELIGCNSENSRSWEETVRETRQEEIKRLPSKALGKSTEGRINSIWGVTSMLFGELLRKRRKICSIESHFPFFSRLTAVQ